MNEPYENNNQFPWDSDSTYRYIPPKKEKKPISTGKVIAIALVCSLLGGMLGAGCMFVCTQYLTADPESAIQTDVSNFLEGQRETAVIETHQINTGKLMTQAEVYAANVNSTVGITTSITSQIMYSK